MANERDPQDRLEAILAEASRDTGGAPTTPHLPDDVLAACAEGRRRPDRRERRHLAQCAECREVMAFAAENVEAAAATKPWWQTWAAGLVPLAVAAAAVGLFVLPPATTDDGYRARGTEADAQRASFTLLATAPDGRRRVLESGDRIPLSARLGFRYGNPSGEAQTLTVLGWDGKAVHWYYPEEAGAPPPEVEGGATAMNIRLPFDVKLEAEHRPGPLTVVAAFDADPSPLAKALERGEVPTNAHVLKLRIEPGG